MSVFSAPAFDGHELVSFCEDKSSGLRAIIAVHDSTLGAGVGGCTPMPATRKLCTTCCVFHEV